MNQRTNRLAAKVGVVLLVAQAFSGCAAYMLDGKVISGELSAIEVVWENDPRLSGPGLPNAELRVHRDPESLGRYLAAHDRSGATGAVRLRVDEFGAGWMDEQWLLQCVKPGYQNAEALMKLPSKPDRWRLLITLAEGVMSPLDDHQDYIEDYERFR